MYQSSTAREKRNWELHQLFVRQDFDQCLEVIEHALVENRGQCEYPIYVKGIVTSHILISEKCFYCFLLIYTIIFLFWSTLHSVNPASTGPDCRIATTFPSRHIFKSSQCLQSKTGINQLFWSGFRLSQSEPLLLCPG